MDKDIFSSYQQLLARLDVFAGQLAQKHGKNIVCAPGCSACCGQVLELLPVEFYYLQTAALALELHKPGTAPAVCPLLKSGLCELYQYRPVICRTHGMPLAVEENGLQRIDCCPENFRDTALNTLSGHSLLDLERVNLLLVSINHIFAKAVGIDAGQRISIARIFSPVQTPV